VRSDDPLLSVIVSVGLTFAGRRRGGGHEEVDVVGGRADRREQALLREGLELEVVEAHRGDITWVL
jgi:hypothetical protein